MARFDANGFPLTAGVHLLEGPFAALALELFEPIQAALEPKQKPGGQR